MKYCLKQNSKHEGENENNCFIIIIIIIIITIVKGKDQEIINK
jgi:hypothetical protein